MITYRDSSIFFVSAALLVCDLAPAKVTFSLRPETILPGERATLTVSLPDKDLLRPEGSDPEEAPVQQDDLLVQSSHFQLLEQDYRKEDASYVWRYQLTSYEVGKLTIPPIEIRLGPQTFSTESTSLEVLAPRKAGDQEIRPEFGEVSVGISWTTWLAVLAVMSGLAYAFYRFRKPRPRRVPTAPVVPRENDEDWLRRRLTELRRQLDVEPDTSSGAVVDRLAGVLREYLARKTAQPVSAWTTRQIKTSLPENWSAPLTPWFEASDRWKFAGEKKVNLAREARALAQSGLQTGEATLLRAEPARRSGAAR